MSYAEQFSDTACTQSVVTIQNVLTCANMVGQYGSSRGLCNADPSVLPVPAGNYSTDV